MIGLGRMGGNMAKRLEESGHEVKTFDPQVDSSAATLKELRDQLDTPRTFWMMVPAGKITEETFQTLLGLAASWRYGSVVRSWPLELLHAAFEKEGRDLEKIRGYVEDSGEGRWTIAEAIAEDVPVPVISAALFARFASRQEESFAAKVNAALRNQFGGHAIRAVEAAQASPDPR